MKFLFLTAALSFGFAFAGCQNHPAGLGSEPGYAETGRGAESRSPREPLFFPPGRVEDPTQRRELLTRLEAAIRSGDNRSATNMIPLLLPLTEQESEEDNPLHWAAEMGSPEIVAYLVSKRVPIDRSDPFGYTALMLAASGPPDEAANYLATRKHTPDFERKNRSYLEVIRILLNAGADPNKRSNESETGFTARTCAEGSRNQRALELLKPSSGRAR